MPTARTNDIDLSVVTAPALVLHDEHLPTANQETIAELCRQLGNADPTVEVVPGSGHASTIDDPSYFSTALRAFLTDRVHGDAIGGTDSGERARG